MENIARITMVLTGVILFVVSFCFAMIVKNDEVLWNKTKK
jgi:hypothetical protein